MQKDILLTTFNARYAHTSIALRYLFANLHELQEHAHIVEFVINENIQSIAEKLLAFNPKIIGISTYIWNANDVEALIEILKKVAPHVCIVLGGPEASYQPFRVNFSLADYIVQGEGEESFYRLCQDILAGKLPHNQVVLSSPVNIDNIQLPYDFYTSSDIAHRTIYVEASRGCPFRCEFCLSSIDKKVRKLHMGKFLEELEKLWQRGVRHFKFIDRTFNLNIDDANQLLDFFLTKKEHYLVHFEVIPDNFPESLKEKISQFPPATLQLEVGIQTLNREVAKRINRPLNKEKIIQNIHFLNDKTHAHLHLDLIVGLPGESLESFGENLNQLCHITSSEIQIGILKKLSGTTLSRHDQEYGMVYSDKPPYDLLANHNITFHEMQELKRFARFWDLYYNSGNFNQSIRLLWNEGSVYHEFLALSRWIYAQTLSTWKFSLDRLCELLLQYFIEVKMCNPTFIADILSHDILKVGGRYLPPCLKPYVSEIPSTQQKYDSAIAKRQMRHTSENMV